MLTRPKPVFVSRFAEKTLRLRRAVLALALALAGMVAGCGTPKYRYHFSTKGGAERFPRDIAAASPRDAGTADLSAPEPPASPGGTAPR